MIIITTNRRAYHDYEILEIIEAGIVLKGDEVKSVRNKSISINDSFATISNGNLMLLNCYIAPYKHAYSKDDVSRQSRKLLMHRREITKMVGSISRKGLTLVPLKVYINDRGYVKIELGIAKHKKAVSKKRELKERDIRRETARQEKIRLR
jgi:SsrA-binding protein